MALIFSPELLPKVLDGSKTVTRRRSPRKVGSLQAVQPGRGKKQVAKVRVVSCVRHSDWEASLVKLFTFLVGLKELLDFEAIKEGFYTWEGFKNKVKELYKQDWEEIKNQFFRIEFELVK